MLGRCASRGSRSLRYAVNSLPSPPASAHSLHSLGCQLDHFWSFARGQLCFSPSIACSCSQTQAAPRSSTRCQLGPNSQQPTQRPSTAGPVTPIQALPAPEASKPSSLPPFSCSLRSVASRLGRKGGAGEEIARSKAPILSLSRSMPAPQCNRSAWAGSTKAPTHSKLSMGWAHAS